jgi:hypothetical protein
MSALAYSADDPKWQRPRGWRRLDAWHPEQVRPCGDRDVLRWHYWHRYGAEGTPPDLRDCLSASPKGKPWLLVVWEPLITKAPGPHLASIHCCYIKTVIFYHTPYVCSPWRKLWDCNGRRTSNGSPGHFEEWDQIETRLSWDDQLIYRGEIFEKGGGRVVWANAPGERRRWWMRHSLRRNREAER